MRYPRDAETEARAFWAKVIKSSSDECWPWIGTRDRHGYGGFRFRGAMTKAPRVAFFLEHGRMPKGCACHRCDNPTCCNPRHLYDGTQRENAADRELRRRGNQPTGERNGCAKLTEGQVLEIRASYVPRRISQQALADRFGVSQAVVSEIVRGRKWRHLLDLGL